jgi:hypothetical protein
MNPRIFKTCLIASLLLVFTPIVSGQSVSVTDYAVDELLDILSGVIENTGDDTVYGIMTPVSYFDAGGNLLYLDNYSAAYVQILKPGDRTPFVSAPDINDFDHVTFDVSFEVWEGPMPYREFSVEEISRETGDLYWDAITFEITNTGELDATSVQLIIICYDSTGSVLPFLQSTTIGESIEASQSTTGTVNMIPSETQDMELIVICADFEQTPTETPPTTTTPPTTQPDTPDPETGGIPGFPLASIALGSLIALTVGYRKPEI